MAVRPGARLGSGRSGIPYRRNSFGVAFSASNPFGIGGESWKRFVPDLRAGFRLATEPPLDGERSLILIGICFFTVDQTIAVRARCHKTKAPRICGRMWWN